MRKRGQAAMEFLMTYGWALLVVLVAIGALSFFGVLDPGKFLPDSCTLGPGLACDDFKVEKLPDPDTGTISLSVINGLGKDLDLFVVEIVKNEENLNQLCGGYFGAVVEEGNVQNQCDSDPGSKCKHVFKDGDTKVIRGMHFYGEYIYLNNPVYCFDASGRDSCCLKYEGILDNTDYLQNPVVGIENCNIDKCNDAASTGDHPIVKGSRFKAKLKIIYKTQDSNILHERMGSLITRVE